MKGFGKYAQANVGQPTLDEVMGQGEVYDVDVQAHVQALHGINVWAGMSIDGTPLPTDGPVTYGRDKGFEHAKASQQPHDYQGVLKGRK